MTHDPIDSLGETFRCRDALAVGITEDALRTAAFVHLRHGCYAVRTPDALVEGKSWLMLAPGSAMYGLTAAQWYGLPVQGSDTFHVVVPRGQSLPRKRPGFHPHHGYVNDDEVIEYKGMPVTSPERTWLDLALSLGRNDLVVVGDAMVRAGLTEPDLILSAAESARRRRGIVKTREHARMIRAGVDSPPETVVRLILVDGGLPEPEVNPDVFDEGGGWIGRPDLAYKKMKIAIQHEGDIHRRDKKQWQKDVARDEAFAENGWIVIRLTARDFRRPWYLCERVRSAIRQRSRS